MVTVNGAQYILSPLDNIETVLLHIASRMETAPRYLYFPEGLPVGELAEGGGNIEVQDVLPMIVDQNTISISTVLQRLDPMLSQLSLVLSADVIIPFVATNRVFARAEDAQRRTFLMVMEQEISDRGITLDEVELEQIWDDRQTYIERLRALVRSARDRNEMYRRRFAIFDEVAHRANVTDFVLEQIKLDASFRTSGLSLMDVLNDIQLSPKLPFASFSDIYKIIRGFLPFPSWDISLPDVCLLKAAKPRETTKQKETDFSDWFISVRGPYHDQELVFNMLVDFESGGSIADAVTTVTDALGGLELGELTTEEKNVSGTFFYPGQDLNLEVLSDLILNDLLFSSLLAVNESRSVVRKKNTLYVYFKDLSVGLVTATVTPKVVQTHDPIWTTQSRDIFPPGSSYVRVRVKVAHNQQAVERFRMVFGRMLVLYSDRAAEVIAFYRRFIPDFASAARSSVGRRAPRVPGGAIETRLKVLVPDLFVANYTRKCPSPVRMVDDREAARLRHEGASVMTYPRTGEYGDPHNYVCTNDPEKPFPGLMPNSLASADKYPWLPCCYVKDQREVQGSYYNHYYHDHPLPPKAVGKQQDLFTTDKFGNGTLPPDTRNFIQLYDTDDLYDYVRRGYTRSTGSILVIIAEAVFHRNSLERFLQNPRFATYPSRLSETIFAIARGYATVRNRREEQEATGDIDKSNVEKARVEREQNWVRTTREAMCIPELYEVCRQSLYDYSMPDAFQLLGNADHFLDPLLFTAALETVFGCDLYTFVRRDEKTSLNLPRFSQNYLMGFPSRPRQMLVVAYMHMGSESNQATFFQCELIARWKTTTKRDMQYMFSPSDPLGKCVIETSRSLQASYSLTEKIQGNNNLELIPDVRVTGQTIDIYGKCRRVDVLAAAIADGEIRGTILMTPNKPQIAPAIVDGTPPHLLSMKSALLLAARLNVKVTGQGTTDGETVEIAGTLSDVRIIIPTVQSRSVSRLPVYRSTRQMSDDGKYRRYNQSKKIARYLQDYILWLYSGFLHDRSDETPSLDNLQDFVQEKISLIDDPAYRYGHVVKRYDLRSGVMTQSHAPRLIVTSDEMLRRLVYWVRLFATNNIDVLKKYYLRTSIEHYYADIADFSDTPGCIVLQGQGSVVKWIEEMKTANTVLHNSLDLTTLSPYYFKSGMLGDMMFIVQNTSSLGSALAVSKHWNTHKYNMGYDDSNRAPLDPNAESFILYSYVDPSNITEHKKGSNPDMAILGWKREGSPHFAAMLPLSMERSKPIHPR